MQKSPILVTILAWIIFIFGILTTLLTLPTLIFGFLGRSLLVFGAGLIISIQGIFMVAVSSGLRKMKMWSLIIMILISFVSVLQLIDLIGKRISHPQDYIEPVLLLLITTYLWSIKNRFHK